MPMVEVKPVRKPGEERVTVRREVVDRPGKRVLHWMVGGLLRLLDRRWFRARRAKQAGYPPGANWRVRAEPVARRRRAPMRS